VWITHLARKVVEGPWMRMSATGLTAEEREAVPSPSMKARNESVSGRARLTHRRPLPGLIVDRIIASPRIIKFLARRRWWPRPDDLEALNDERLDRYMRTIGVVAGTQEAIRESDQARLQARADVSVPNEEEAIVRR
jgi:hypothetical protein